MIVNYIILLVMSLIASIASFSLKMSTSRGTVISIVKNKYLYFGGLLYILASLLNIWILKQLPYSVVLPLGSICFIWTMFIAGIFLKEKIGIGKIIGVFLILSGVILIATS